MSCMTRCILALAIAFTIGGCHRDAGSTPEKREFGAAAGPHDLLYVADTAQAMPAQSAGDVNDDVITARVTSALDADPTLNGAAIDVTTRGRIVRLHGVVNSEAAAHRATAVVLAVEGVGGVDNRLNTVISN